MSCLILTTLLITGAMTAAPAFADPGGGRSEKEAARIAAVTAPATDFSKAEPYEALPGGGATSKVTPDTNAFSQFSETLTFEQELKFKIGNGLFRKTWVSAPSSTLASDGLGPLYNARACQRCHLKDGRGHPPAAGEEAAISFALKIAVPAERETLRPELAAITGYHATAPHPAYGAQIQEFATQGLKAEGLAKVKYEEFEVELSEGESAVLRRPLYRIENQGFGAPGAEAMLSPRVAPQMIGLGLVEAVPAAEILAHADPEDADGDGISGKASLVWSDEHQKVMLGRFGLKAGAPTVRQQSANAFSTDMGISSPLHPEGWGDCTGEQSECRAAPDGNDARDGGFEIGAEGLDLVAFYSRNLAVPKRRDVDDPEVLRGKAVFYAAGCISCHVPKFVTARDEGRKEHSFQLIWPYGDFLLHDMGEGLADGFAEGVASGSEWRTAPLWGVGLTQTVSGHNFLLHDGRARGVLEAILWHGGEAQNARDAVVMMPKADRAALIRFVESL